MAAICCLEKVWLSLLQGSSQNDGRMGQTFSKVLKREEVRQIKILEVQEGSFYWWRFKCDVELNASLYKNLHSTELQKSKRRLFSQKLGCSETTRADLKNQRGASFLKSWATQRPRGPISEIEEAPAFSASSAPVTCTLSFDEITGNLSKISGEAREFQSSSYPTITHKGKGTSPLLDNWKVPMCVDLRVLWQDSGTAFRISRARSPTGLLVRKPKRHISQNFESQISLDKACKPAKMLNPFSHSRMHPQHNLSKYSALFPPDNTSANKPHQEQEYIISSGTKRKRAVSRNLKSNLQSGTDCLRPLPGCLLSIALENSSSTAVKVMNSTGTYLMTVDQILALYTEAAKPETDHYSTTHFHTTFIIPSTAKVSHIIKSALYSEGNQKTLQHSSRISLWKVTSSKAKLGDLGDSYYRVCIALNQARNYK
ncbi:hypothetical protein ACFX1T_002918 [Malus domestica]